MSALSFTIDPDAVFGVTDDKPQSTRDVLWCSQNKPARPGLLDGLTLPGGKRTAGLAEPGTRTVTGLETRKASFPNLVSAGNAVTQIRQSNYKKYLISTSLRLKGTWVASYGRPGAPFEAGVNPVRETPPYLAEALALADATLEIDDRRKSPHKPLLYERRKTSSRRRLERVTINEDATD